MAVLKQDQFISAFIARLAGGSGVNDNHPGNNKRASSGDIGGGGDAAAASSEAAQQPQPLPAFRDDLESMFCSKLIAAIFKECGLLAPHRVSSDFLPKHFSAPFDGYLDLQNGALLGPELPINFASVADEIAALPPGTFVLVRVKNRFAKPLFNGYQDGLYTIALAVGRCWALCEVQLHIAAVLAHKESREFYEHFRAYFSGSSDTVEKRITVLDRLGHAAPSADALLRLDVDDPAGAPPAGGPGIAVQRGLRKQACDFMEARYEHEAGRR